MHRNVHYNTQSHTLEGTMQFSCQQHKYRQLFQTLDAFRQNKVKQTLLACRWYFLSWPTVDDLLRFQVKHEETVVGVPVEGVRAPYQVGMKYSLD